MRGGLCWCAVAGWEKVMNKGSRTFRALPAEARENLDEAKARSDHLHEHRCRADNGVDQRSLLRSLYLKGLLSRVAVASILWRSRH